MTNSPDRDRRLRHDNGKAAEEVTPASLRELLAEIEHEQWCSWSRTLAESERLTAERLEGWTRRWVGYGELAESDKDLDREYADRVIELLTRIGVLPAEQGNGND